MFQKPVFPDFVCISVPSSVCIHACAYVSCVCECVYVFVCVAQKDADMKVTGEEVTSYHKWKHEASLV